MDSEPYDWESVSCCWYYRIIRASTWLFRWISIAVYAASHNVQKLDISADASRKRAYKCGGVSPLPLSLSVFSCSSLQQLCLDTRDLWASNLPESTWILPALTTLVLKQVSFEFCCDGHSSKSVDLFSNLLNLKNLTLYDCSTNGLEVFNVFTPQLENLVIGSRYYRYLCKFVVSAPKLLSFQYTGDYGLLISTNDLNSLEKVYINIGGIFGYHTIVGDYEKKQKIRQEVIHMFHQLHGARFVLLTLYTIEVIAWALDLVQNEPSPFSKMECLKIEGRHYRYEESKLPIGVITYLSNSSPKPTVINESKEYFQDSWCG